MKTLTLDETIAWMDEVIFEGKNSDEEFWSNFVDALHYLKEYRSDMLMYAANQKHWEDELKQKIKDFGDAKDRYIAKLKELDIGTLNNPLTWQELKQMEGKPVWYEHEFWKGWIILGKVEQGVTCEMIPDREERWYIVKDGSAKAYRKERE